jgi:hypothetical protein
MAIVMVIVMLIDFAGTTTPDGQSSVERKDQAARLETDSRLGMANLRLAPPRSLARTLCTRESLVRARRKANRNKTPTPQALASRNTIITTGESTRSSKATWFTASEEIRGNNPVEAAIAAGSDDHHSQSLDDCRTSRHFAWIDSQLFHARD